MPKEIADASWYHGYRSSLGACLACALHACHCGGSGCVHVRTAAAAVAGVPGLRAGTRSLESGNLSTMALAEPIPD